MWLRAYAVTMHAQRHSLATRHGRTSAVARMAHEQCLRIDRVIAKLVVTRETATVERAVQSQETPARNVTDDMPFVYGKPRNDPRTPKNRIR